MISTWFLLVTSENSGLAAVFVLHEKMIRLIITDLTGAVTRKWFFINQMFAAIKIPAFFKAGM